MTNEELTVSTLRMLSTEAIEKAKSGHPGICLGAAPIGFTLFAKHLKHNPKDPAFSTGTGLFFLPDTDRRCCIRCSMFSATVLPKRT